MPQGKKTLEKEKEEEEEEEEEGESGSTERREVKDTEGRSKDHVKVVPCEESNSEGHQSEESDKDSTTEASSKAPRSDIDEVTKTDEDHKVAESEGHKSIRSDSREDATKRDENCEVTKSDTVTDDRAVSRAMMLLEGSSEASHAMGAYHMNSQAMQERVRNFVLSRRKSSEPEKSRERGEEHTTISNGIGLSISHMLKQEPNNNEHHFVSPQRIADDRTPSGDGYHKLHHRTSALDDPPRGESVITMHMSHRCYGDRSPLPERHHRYLHHHHHHHHHHRGMVDHSQIPEAHSMKRRHNGYFSCSLSPVANGYYGPPSPGGIVKCDDVPIPLKKVSEYKDMVAGGNCVDMTMSVMSLSVAARGIIQYQTGTGCDRDHLFTGVSKLSFTSE